jgi:hypothetical protein
MDFVFDSNLIISLIFVVQCCPFLAGKLLVDQKLPELEGKIMYVLSLAGWVNYSIERFRAL